MAIESPSAQSNLASTFNSLVTPSRRGMIAMAASGIILPKAGWAVSTVGPTPAIAPFVREKAAVRDTRFGKGSYPDGRAILPLEATAKRVWLDTTASAKGDGRSPATAFKSEVDAYAALRGGDQLMIASRSVVTQPIKQMKSLGGRSAAYPTVVQSYDRALPLDETRYGLLSNRVTYYGESAMFANFHPAISFFAIRGIRLDHSASAKRISYAWSAGLNWLLIEQCAFLAAQLSLNSADGTKAHVIRQCAFQGQWSATAHAQGLYTSGNFDTVIEECTFYHCGWKMGITRAAGNAAGGPTIFNHGIYAAVRSGGILRRCVFVETSSHGAQLRGNWHSHDNVFIACPLALLHGGGTTYAYDAPNGVMALCYRNIVTISQSITPTLPRGIGIDVSNTRPGSIVEQNLIVGPGALAGKAAFSASAHLGDGYAPNPTAITFQRNTNSWSNAAYNSGPGGKDGWPDRVFVADKDNVVLADKMSFADGKRDGLSAARALGYATIDDLGYAIVADPTKAWALNIGNHIRPGYAPRTLSLKAGTTSKGAVLPDGSWNA